MVHGPWSTVHGIHPIHDSPPALSDAPKRQHSANARTHPSALTAHALTVSLRATYNDTRLKNTAMIPTYS